LIVFDFLEEEINLLIIWGVLDLFHKSVPQTS
jgi:hypothetical protein